MCYVGPIPLKSVSEGQNGVGGMTNGRLLIENKSIGRRQQKKDSMDIIKISEQKPEARA